MTLSKHVLFLKLGLSLCASGVIGIALISKRILPLYKDLAASAYANSSIFFQTIPAHVYAPFLSAAASLLFALSFLILIFYFFEKTQSMEIRFLSVFVFTLFFEVLRTIIPITQVVNLPLFYIDISARLLIFTRFLGVFSIFAASLFVSGLKQQKEESIMIPAFIIAALIALRVPIDVFSWDTSLAANYGYKMMFRLFEVLVVLIAFSNFIVGAYLRSAKTYIKIGFGILAAFFGRTLLIYASFNVEAFAGFILLCASCFYSGVHLRRMYLWL
ncbi:MAG: hypothetical protein Ta2G_20180 [Termitinemataceae bacterium]|nr:MAG: hypothetical protein Ta2G_20180 [Termitinemataceae bacterium]